MGRGVHGRQVTIEEEIRNRLRVMGMDEESVGPCMTHIKADPLCRGLEYVYSQFVSTWEERAIESFWQCAKSSALDYLEVRKSPVTIERDGEEERTCLDE